MEKVKKFLKKNKSTVIVVICCLILTILIFTVKLTFFPNEAKAIYGNRLDGIKSVKIKSSDLEQIESTLKEQEGIKKVDAITSGKILNVIITLKKETDRDTAKQYPEKILEELEDDQKDFYDIQVLIEKEDDEDKVFPIIAYRHEGDNEFSFTKDR